MQKLSLVLGLLWFASGNIAQANTFNEAQAVDNRESPSQVHCTHWSAALLLAATDPTLPDFLQHQPHCLQKIHAGAAKRRCRIGILIRCLPALTKFFYLC
jgi:hypothetical protein